MGDKSSIQWTDATWNPTTGCDRVSPGCANCYALTLAPRLQKMSIARAVKDGMGPFPDDPYMRDGDPKTSGPGFGLMLHPSRLDTPIRWKRPRRIFVNSMSDLFHPEVPDEFLDQVFAVMALAPQHIFQVLTKRPERMRAYMNEYWGDGYTEPRYDRSDRVWDCLVGIATQQGILKGLPADPKPEDYTAWDERRAELAAKYMKWPLPNVWLGTSVENARWRTRITELRHTPAAVRFLSCEPLLGPLVCPECKGWGWDAISDPSDPTGMTAMQVPCPGSRRYGFVQGGLHGHHDLDLTGVDWVIVGGESGEGAREMSEEWVRDIVRSCRDQDVWPFVKQMGSVWSQQHLGHDGHAGNPEEWPADLQVREMPA